MLAREAMILTATNPSIAQIPVFEYPQLFGCFEAFDVRMQAVMERKRERIDLNSKIKGLVRDAFSEFKFDGADPDGLRFTRRLSDHLEQVLLFEKIHHLGLGKSFTIEIEYQFPKVEAGRPAAWRDGDPPQSL